MHTHAHSLSLIHTHTLNTQEMTDKKRKHLNSRSTAMIQPQNCPAHQSLLLVDLVVDGPLVCGQLFVRLLISQSLLLSVLQLQSLLLGQLLLNQCFLFGCQRVAVQLAADVSNHLRRLVVTLRGLKELKRQIQLSI